jgi:hypothetical protein
LIIRSHPFKSDILWEVSQINHIVLLLYSQYIIIIYYSALKTLKLSGLILSLDSLLLIYTNAFINNGYRLIGRPIVFQTKSVGSSPTSHKILIREKTLIILWKYM